MGRANRLKDGDGSRAPVEPAPLAAGRHSKPLSTRLEGIALKWLVFWNGAVVMGLEIAGSRVLAPHFGNSVFVWGSLISIFLIALTLGYFLGGRMADQFPSRILLTSLCILVSLWICAVALFANHVCESLVENGFGEESGPLVASTLLFLAPSIGMGMVSPFAIRLATQAVSTVGTISGTLYALSTLGSIAGTMVTTFVLIPWMGSSAILRGLGVVLLLASVFTLPLHKNRQGLAGATMVVLLVVACQFWSAGPQLPLRPGERLVVDVDTPYHHISVVDDEYQNIRELKFDRFTESSIANTPPYPSTSEYTNYFHLAFLAQPEIRRTVFIGAGGGVGPRAFRMHNPEMAIDVVDIDPKVLEIARDYFYLEESPETRLIAQDGRIFMRKAHEYDCVILDAFTIGGRIPFHLVTREFINLCHDKLTSDGVFVMNINSAIEGPLAGIFHSMLRTIESVFPHTYAFAEDYRARGKNASMNIILLATKNQQQITPDEWFTRAAMHQSSSYVRNDTLRRLVRDLLFERPDLSQAPTFTDDYAPIETMAF